MAKRFRFRLETVERLRKQARDEQRRAVAIAVRELAAAEARAAEWTEQLRRTVELTRSARMSETLDVAALRGSQFHRNWLHGRILESQAEIGQKRMSLDAERIKLGEATAKVKVLEKLRQRRWTRHLQTVAREEQAVADEIAGQGHLRRSTTDESMVAA